MTIEKLCRVIGEVLTRIANSPNEPVDQENGVQLWAAPEDDETRAVMEAFDGMLRITVRELPQQFRLEGEGTTPESVVRPQSNIWHPNDVVPGVLNDGCSGPGQGSGA